MHDSVDIYRLLNSAKKSLIIIDPYFDDTTLQIIEQLKSDTHIKILAYKLQGGTKISFPKFQNERGKIELKTTDKIHDRYLIVDSDKIYLLGSSINNFGNKATTIVPINEPSVMESVINYFKEIWNKNL
ncbi:phospholipase D-like domain-containing protein [Schinkia sp. CFF1]